MKLNISQGFLSGYGFTDVLDQVYTIQVGDEIFRLR